MLLALPVLFSGIGGTPATFADDIRGDIANARRQQQELQEQIREQNQAISELRAAEAALQDALAKTGEKLDAVNADLTAVRAQMDQAEAALRKVEERHAHLVAELEHLDWTLGLLEDELVSAEKDLAGRRRLLAQRLEEAYRTGRTSLLEQMMASDSLSDVLANVGSHLRFGTQDAQLASQIERDQKQVDVLRKQTGATRYKTDQMRVEVHRKSLDIQAQQIRLDEAKKRLEVLEAETKRLQAQQMATYEETLETREQQEKVLLEQRSAQLKLKGHLAWLVKELERRGNIPSVYNGTFEWPMVGRVSQEYGCTGFPWEPPQGSCKHFHKGIDVVSPWGTPITAAADGVVIFVGYNPADPPPKKAWIVLVAHSANLVTWYAHMQPRTPPGLREGTAVRKGDVIGWEGSTGRSTGPHLHWGVQLDSRFVNPRLFT